jgi:hypothetical protein
MEWRRRWAANWESVRYCSDACRRRGGPGEVGRRLEEAIEDLLSRRRADATICPSEAARAVGGEDWRELMEPARAAGRRLAARGRVEFTQKGHPVDPSRARGPVRLRRTGSS